MHIFGGVDDLAIADRILAQHAIVASGPGLQIGDADHVVVGHGHGDVLRRRRGERIRSGVSTVAAVKFVNFCDAVEILARVGRILKVGQALDAREQHRLKRRGKFADARQQPVEIRMAGRGRKRREALGGLSRQRLRGGLRL